MLKEYKIIRRIQQKYLAAYGEYADRYKIERIIKAKWAKKPSHATVLSKVFCPMHFTVHVSSFSITSIHNASYNLLSFYLHKEHSLTFYLKVSICFSRSSSNIQYSIALYFKHPSGSVSYVFLHNFPSRFHQFTVLTRPNSWRKYRQKVLRVFLLSIHSHLYGFALRCLFLQTHEPLQFSGCTL